MQMGVCGRVHRRRYILCTYMLCVYSVKLDRLDKYLYTYVLLGITGRIGMHKIYDVLICCLKIYIFFFAGKLGRPSDTIVLGKKIN